MWQTLPPELTTRFGAFPTNPRTLQFRGFEMTVTHFSPPGTVFAGPSIELRDTLPNPAVLERWLPGPNLYASFPSIPGLITAGSPIGSMVRLAAKLSSAAAVPAGSPAGLGLTLVWTNIQTIGGFPNLLMVSSTTEPSSTGIAAFSFSGFSYTTSAGTQNGILPNSIGSGSSGEFCFTWLFDDPVIQPVKNAQITSASGMILGGGPSPAPFTVQFEDGRGALYARGGEAISYNGNSRLGNPVQGSAGTVFFCPFVVFSGDMGPPGLDPAPEHWVAGRTPVKNTSVRKWIDDLCFVSSACPAGTGALVDPGNHSSALWTGVDLPLFNSTILMGSLAFADVSQGTKWAGPATVAHDSIAAPFGILSRNPVVASAAYVSPGGLPLPLVSEHRTLLTPQAGYTPCVNGTTLPNGMFGFGIYPGGLGGHSISIHCWMLDMTTGKIVDTTNLAVVRLL
jgi:hypothetical protein